MINHDQVSLSRFALYHTAYDNIIEYIACKEGIAEYVCMYNKLCIP